MRRLLPLLLLVSTALAVPAQAQVEPGDLALVGLYHDDADAFAFVALAEIPQDAALKFTDNGWRRDGGFRANEQTMEWSATAAIPAGTVVTFTCESANAQASATPSHGTIVSGSLCGLATAGDQILVYRGDDAAPVFVYALNNEGTSWQEDATSANTSALPTGLTDGLTAVALPELDNYAYTGPTSGSATDLLASISNPANWTGSDERATVPGFPTAFSVDGSTDPTPVRPSIRFEVSNLRVAEGDAPVRVFARLSAPSEETVTVDLTVGSGTATLDADFTFGPARLTFTPGTDTASTRFVVIDDEVEEAAETITLQLGNPSENATLGSPSTVTLTIADNDAAPVSFVTLFPGVTGAALLDSLRRVYTPSTLGYGPARQELFGFIWNDEGVVEGFYTGLTISVPPGAGDATGIAFGQDFNTEHAWPQSVGAGDEPRRSDLYNLFPTKVGVNGDRANLPFGEVNDAQTLTWYYLNQRQSAIPSTNIDAWSELGSGRFEPRERVKGDVARSQFYFYALYSAFSDAGYFAAVRDDLYTWHRTDTVDATERLRHDRIAQVQGNANPFVLDSSLVRRAFFSGPVTEPPADSLVTVAAARQRGNGATVRVRGIVTRAKGAFTYFQDETGGLVVRQTTGAFFEAVRDGALTPGDSLEVRGVLSSFNNLLQINAGDLQDFALLSSDNALPDPIEVSAEQVLGEGEQYESRLIRLAGLSFSDAGTFAANRTYQATVEGRVVDVRIGNANDTDVDGLPIPASPVSFEGVLGQFSASDASAGYQLMPIAAGDFYLTTGVDGVPEALAFTVHGVSPSPVRTRAELRLSLPVAAVVEVAVFDVTGRQVLAQQVALPSGTHVPLVLDAASLPAGVYLYRLSLPADVATSAQTGRFIVIR